MRTNRMARPSRRGRIGPARSDSRASIPILDRVAGKEQYGSNKRGRLGPTPRIPRETSPYDMYSGKRLSDCEFVAVDLEPTGPTPGRNSIIEIGAVLVRDGVIADTLQVLVRPAESVP